MARGELKNRTLKFTVEADTDDVMAAMDTLRGARDRYNLAAQEHEKRSAAYKGVAKSSSKRTVKYYRDQADQLQRVLDALAGFGRPDRRVA